MPDVTLLDPWNAAEAVARCPITPWRGTVWRAHASIYAATDPAGARRKSGRYHRAPDDFPDGPVWAVLYLALGRDVCLGEILRNVTTIPVRDYRITRLRIGLAAVLDCRDLTLIGLTLDDVVGVIDYETPQRLAGAAFVAGVEAMLVPSATLLGDNLIVFVDQFRLGSRPRVVDHVEPNLAKLPLAFA